MSILKRSALLQVSQAVQGSVSFMRKSSDISEIYGQSKDSGISYLMNEFNLPCLLNSNFLNFTELRNGSLYFENFSKMYKLYSKIKKNNKHRLSLMKKIKNDTKNFTVKNYSQKLNKIFT